jgi:hypothetical protein
VAGVHLAADQFTLKVDGTTVGADAGADGKGAKSTGAATATKAGTASAAGGGGRSAAAGGHRGGLRVKAAAAAAAGAKLRAVGGFRAAGARGGVRGRGGGFTGLRPLGVATVRAFA